MVTGLSQPEAQTTDGHTDEKLKLMNNLFIGAVTGILRAEEVIKPDELSNHPAVSGSIEAFNQTIGVNWIEFYEGNVADAIVAFEKWVREAGYMYIAPVLYTISNMTITATMQTQSGQLSVAMQVYPTDGAEMSDVIRAAKGELQDAIGRAFSNAQTPPLPETTKRTEESNVADVMALRVVKDRGSLSYRIIPRSGRWIRYGIPVYLEQAMALGFNKYGEGDHPMSGTVVFSTKPDGNPKNVTEYFK